MNCKIRNKNCVFFLSVLVPAVTELRRVYLYRMCVGHEVDASRLAFRVACLSNHTGIRITLCCPDYFATNPCGNINADMKRCIHTHFSVSSWGISQTFLLFLFPDDDFRQEQLLNYFLPPLQCMYGEEDGWESHNLWSYLTSRARCPSLKLLPCVDAACVDHFSLRRASVWTRINQNEGLY